MYVCMYVCMYVLYSSQSWVSFLKSSILDELKYYLQMGDIQSACCLQNRHIVSSFYNIISVVVLYFHYYFNYVIILIE